MAKQYVPDFGDFVIINFTPKAGHEQAGRRPGLVISNKIFNKATGLAFIAPLTNSDRNIPFHVLVPKKGKFTGYIMVDQVRSVDYVARDVQFMHKAQTDILESVLGILGAILAPAGDMAGRK